MTCAELGPDLVALALGQLPAGEAEAVETHLAACAPCRTELAATRSLLSSARGVPALEPAADAEARLLAALRSERAGPPGADVPEPVAKRRGVARILSMVLPLAAAAAVLVSVIVSSRGRRAEVIDGEGFFWDAASPLATEPISGRFDFIEGQEIRAARGPFTVRLTLAAGAGAPVEGRPAPGVVEMTLLPGTRVERTGDASVRLAAGAVDIAAGSLSRSFTVEAPPGRATVKGTRFSVATTDERLVVAVSEGSVELAKRDGPAELLAAGDEGLVDAARVIKRSGQAPRPPEGGADRLREPRAKLEFTAPPPGSADRLRFTATWSVGDAGPVTLMAFDEVEPRFLVELSGPDGREREVKLQRAMLVDGPPPAAQGLTFLLTTETPYRLVFSLDEIGLEPGRYRVRVRSMSYRPRGSGAEWLGVVESEPVEFEVSPK